MARRRELPVVGTGLPLGVAVELPVIRRRARRRRRAAQRRGGRLRIAAELALQLRTRADLGTLGRPATALDTVDGARAGGSRVPRLAALGVLSRCGRELRVRRRRRLRRGLARASRPAARTSCGGELPTLDPDFWCSSSCSSQSSWVVTPSRSAIALISFASHPCCACSAKSSAARAPSPLRCSAAVSAPPPSSTPRASASPRRACVLEVRADAVGALGSTVGLELQTHRLRPDRVGRRRRRGRRRWRRDRLRAFVAGRRLPRGEHAPARREPRPCPPWPCRQRPIDSEFDRERRRDIGPLRGRPSLTCAYAGLRRQPPP